jgi:hypothetical protein
MGALGHLFAENQNTGYNRVHDRDLPGVEQEQRASRFDRIDRLDFRRGATEIFKSLNLRNPLKSHDSDEKIQEKPSK